ncbi:MAG TPA: SDR family NAD(P)-dependent oxidoreductase [Trebonia sp.]|nr:SDR family NAD(P)-dependent oxidoreductase [Trebonia sp.]
MKVLLLGGTSEIGLAILSALDLAPDTEVVLAGRDVRRMEIAAKTLPCRRVTVLPYDARDTASHQDFAAGVCADGMPDLVIAATGILIPESRVQQDPSLAPVLIETNFTGQVTTLLAFGSRMAARGHGTIVVLSSVAATRPRRFNPLYGAAKAGLDAFARGYADALHGSGVRLLLVRPGFVIGRMTDGMRPAPLATTPEKVGVVVAQAVARPASAWERTIWVPPALAGLAAVMRLVPRPLWRKLDR